MNSETKAFHDLIVLANKAHKAFNTSGPAVAQNALFDLRALALALMQRLTAIEKHEESQ